MTASPAIPAVRSLETPLARGPTPHASPGPWSEAWSHVLLRPRAAAAVLWLGIVAFFAAFAPFIASAHPLIMQDPAAGEVPRPRSPLLQSLTPADIAIAAGACLAVPYLAFARRGMRASRLGRLAIAAILAGLAIAAASLVESTIPQRAAPDWALWLRARRNPGIPVGVVFGAVTLLAAALFPPLRRRPSVPIIASV